MKIRPPVAAAFLVAALLLASPTSVRAAEPGLDVPSFRNDVIPVLTKAGCNSGACHGALAGKNGFKLSLRGYDPETDHQVLTREALGRRVVMAAPAQSLILLKPTLTIAHGGGKRFDRDSLEYRVLADWIASGAPAPRSMDPIIQEVFVTPDRILEKEVGKGLQISVTAFYSDGTKRDVTRWAKFSSSNQGVATVDDHGLVSTQGPGEAAVSIWYSSKVAFARITVPYFRAFDPVILERAPKNNFIDGLVLQKLEELRIVPSQPSTDSEFIRRLFLDTLGILPSVAEINQFLADQDRAKRTKWIEKVLGRSEFVDYWSYQWSDLLLVSSRKLDRGGMHSYYNWIRSSVAENKSWDQFVYELITASGSALENGAANYWLIHTKPIDITENLSQSFLGISLTCARCHNHPLEKWTQDQYYGMANLVSRVSLKTGVNPGDVTVISSHAGEINHPRRNRPMRPEPLDGESLDFESARSRRAHLAEWLTSSKNSHFARTVVNRVWANFMGRGLVEPVDDLRATNPASNEELFAALTEDFVKHGFDVQHLVRTILNSATYQASSQTNETNLDDEQYYSHYLIRRLPAEVILDVFSQVTGVDEEFEGYPTGFRAMQLPDTTIDSYFLDSFGRAARITGGSDERRNESTVAQALHLLNGETLNKKLQRENNVIDQLLEQSLPGEALLDEIFKRTLSRAPTLEESMRLLPSAGDADREAVEDLLWGLLTSKEFLFKH